MERSEAYVLTVWHRGSLFSSGTERHVESSNSSQQKLRLNWQKTLDCSVNFHPGTRFILHCTRTQ